MDAIYHWAGLALALLLIGLAFVGFWRGLSLRPTDPVKNSAQRVGHPLAAEPAVKHS